MTMMLLYSIGNTENILMDSGSPATFDISEAQGKEVEQEVVGEVEEIDQEEVEENEEEGFEENCFEDFEVLCLSMYVQNDNVFKRLQKESTTIYFYM